MSYIRELIQELRFWARQQENPYAEKVMYESAKMLEEQNSLLEEWLRKYPNV